MLHASLGVEEISPTCRRKPAERPAKRNATCSRTVREFDIICCTLPLRNVVRMVALPIATAATA